MEFEGTKAGALLNKIFQPEKEEKDMKTKQITKTVFVTSDEKEYLDEQEAKQHEKILILDKELASLRKIDGDFTTCNILRLQPMKIDSGFSWYQIQNKNQEADCIIMLQKRYGHMPYMMQIHEKNDYPSMIGYNQAQNVLVRFDYVQALLQKTNKDFEVLSKMVENAYEQPINNLKNTDEEYERKGKNMLLGSEYDPQKDPQNSVGIIYTDESGHTLVHILEGDTSPKAILEAIKKMQERGLWVTGVKEGDIVTPINTFLNFWSHLNKKPDFPELEIPKLKPDIPELKIPKLKPDLSEPDYPDLDF